MTKFVFSLFLIFILLLNVYSQQTSSSLQCPCYVIPGTNECLQYDSRFQASTLEEAMNSFTDLTMDDDSSSAITPQVVDKECQTEECKTCKEILKERLKEIGLLPASTITSITNNSTSYCNKYKFTQKDDNVIQNDDSSSSEESDEDDDDNETKSSKKSKEKKRRKINRSKRQATNPDPTVVGQRYRLSCEQKGIAVDGSGMMMLCSRCWAWRELPTNYYPRYMNELICDDTDNSCLSGYAQCGVSHRSAYVVRNDTGIVNVVTLQAGSFCECRVQSGTALETLVTGAQGNPLPSVITNKLQTSQLSQNTDTNINNANSLFWF